MRNCRTNPAVSDGSQLIERELGTKSIIACAPVVNRQANRKHPGNVSCNVPSL